MEESQDSYSHCSAPTTPALQSTKNTQPFGIRIVYFPECIIWLLFANIGACGEARRTPDCLYLHFKLWLCAGNISISWEADEK